MRLWTWGIRGAAICYLVIAALVIGGLGWATAAALGLEREQLRARGQSEEYDRLRLALWRLDGRIAPLLAREDARPYSNYSAVYAPMAAFRGNGQPWPAGTVLEPSPLLNADLPDWMLLHFQADSTGWRSPQVLSPTLLARLRAANLSAGLTNVTPARADLLGQLGSRLSADTILASIRGQSDRPGLTDVALVPLRATGQDSAGPPPQVAAKATQGEVQQQSAQGIDPEYLNRAGNAAQLRSQANDLPQRNDRNMILQNTFGNGENWFEPTSKKTKGGDEISVVLGPMVPLWIAAKNGSQDLLVARRVRLGNTELCQGILLDWPKLRDLLVKEVNQDLFPGAAVIPMREAVPPRPERTMSALPIELDPGPSALPGVGWTPLWTGLLLAWLAAIAALAAVGLGGWSLLDLSERRMRFVWAVTHELRTPLTTLRLYLDMLASGLVSSESQRHEYVQTLNAEADRLNRFVSNVLDFSRLESRRPGLAKTAVSPAELLAQVTTTWQGSCANAGKELVLETKLDDADRIVTDPRLVEQILGNLIDNACKYSRDAVDPRIWLRGGMQGRQLVVEVEDRGPGVPLRERRSIFRSFRRGASIDATAGGVGLGLDLAQRWARLLGGKLTVHSAEASTGACFRLELPLEAR
jgi:signal transduction histidine kinase